ncbi:MAG: radical SAM protein [Syntrophobacterales bacterium]|jgi:radical SAM superfamily enzyme YgiQ (UPF0313 family)|nr:radical SAM protein [Syntrophobacterales bacterium]
MNRSLEPFEICHIRPPTENNSLTIRLTRNCGWNRCSFCPVYKGHAVFSRRTIDDVQADIERIGRIDDLLHQEAILSSSSQAEAFKKAEELIRPWEKEIKKHSASSSDDWFSPWFKEESDLRDSVFHVLSWRLGGGETCFLGDADSLILSADFFTDVMARVTKSFPSVKRFTVYGRTASAARKPLEELIAFREAGLHRIHFGLESGSDKVLNFMNKGETAEKHIKGCRKTKEAGLSCSVYIMPGLGGAEWSEEHGRETARVINESSPDFIRLRTLEIFPETPLQAAALNGSFREAPEEQVVSEIRQLIEAIEVDTVLYSDSASNLLTVNGRLPHNKEAMYRLIDRYLDLTPRGKLEFSLMARLTSFHGQYGGLTQEILTALQPFILDEHLNLAIASDHELIRLIRLIRSRLMP